MSSPVRKEEESPQAAAVHRVVLLGASNLTQGFATALATAQSVWGRPLEVYAALGRGRSFGRASRLWGRGLPGILDCGLWRDLEAAPPAETAALITDIGNDILYEEPVERIAAWLEECLDRLDRHGARTVITRLPLANMEGLSHKRFLLFRSLFFPRSRLQLAHIRAAAQALDEHVRRLARERNCGLVEQRRHWYGLDPIHFRALRRGEAWREILSPWSQQETTQPAQRWPASRALYLASRAPHLRSFWGIERRHRQPCGRFSDGTTVSIY